MHLAKADFAAGCFWGVEEALRILPGVTRTEVGYEGGHSTNPTYEQVCSHTTGHAETVQITYNPKKISYQDLLKKLFEIHDPTQDDGQGANIGSNYRSIIFYHTQVQHDQAQKFILSLQKHLSKPVVTELLPASRFWPAEDYHQKYYAKQAGRL